MGFGLFTGVLNKILGAQVLRTSGRSSQPSTRCSAASASAPTKTYALLKDSGTSFVVIAAPERDALREAAYFVERLRTDDMPLAGLVLNRVQRVSPSLDRREQAGRGAQTLDALGGDSGATAGSQRLTPTCSTTAERMHRWRTSERFTASHPGIPLVQVPGVSGTSTTCGGLRRGRRTTSGPDLGPPDR